MKVNLRFIPSVCSACVDMMNIILMCSRYLVATVITITFISCALFDTTAFALPRSIKFDVQNPIVNGLVDHQSASGNSDIVRDIPGINASIVLPQEGALSISRQNDSSPTRSASRACPANRCDQRRNDVPRSASAATPPPATAAHAAARSGTRMRHDTPSTAK